MQRLTMSVLFSLLLAGLVQSAVADEGDAPARHHRGKHHTTKVSKKNSKKLAHGKSHARGSRSLAATSNVSGKQGHHHGKVAKHSKKAQRHSSNKKLTKNSRLAKNHRKHASGRGLASVGSRKHHKAKAKHHMRKKNREAEQSIGPTTRPLRSKRKFASNTLPKKAKWENRSSNRRHAERFPAQEPGKAPVAEVKSVQAPVVTTPATENAPITETFVHEQPLAPTATATADAPLPLDVN